jgi:hypothetical protein
MTKIRKKFCHALQKGDYFSKTKLTSILGVMTEEYKKSMEDK